jgi:hypothetical protein
MLVDTRGIPVPLFAAREVPLAVHLDVVVVVANRHHDPSSADLVFGPAVHVPSRVGAVDEFDTMTDDLVNGPVEVTQQRRDGSAESFPASESTAKDDVGLE